MSSTCDRTTNPADISTVDTSSNCITAHLLVAELAIRHEAHDLPLDLRDLDRAVLLQHISVVVPALGLRLELLQLLALYSDLVKDVFLQPSKRQQQQL